MNRAARQEILRITVLRIRHLCDQIDLATSKSSESEDVSANTGIITERAVLRLGDLVFIAIDTLSAIAAQERTPVALLNIIQTQIESALVELSKKKTS